jgi:hypothetical protein
MAKRSSAGAGVGFLGLNCGCLILILVINLTIGSFCFNYCLGTLWGTQLSWFLAAIGGLFLGEIAIPAAVIIWLITLSGVPTPFFH